MQARLFPLLLLVLVLAAGCGQVPRTAAPAQAATPTSLVVTLPPAPTDLSYPHLPAPTVPLATPLPTATPERTPIVLGSEMAPPEERETYISTTLVVAPVGSGPGEIGYWEAPEAGRIWADDFCVDPYGNVYILDRVNERVALFDPNGSFVTNIPYSDTVWNARLVAADGAGHIYVYDGGTPPQVKLLDLQGNLLREYQIPAWLVPNREISAMQVDEEGTLWVEGRVSDHDVPGIEGDPYQRAAVPLGNAHEVFQQERQRAMTIPGHMLRTGGPMIVHSWADHGYTYDREGRRVYQVPPQEGPIAIDRQSNLYTIRYGQLNQGIVSLTKYDPAGRVIASVDLPAAGSSHVMFTQVWVTPTGVVYTVVWDFDLQEAYYVIRWQPSQE